MHHAERCCSACNFDPQYQATSMAYRADRRATHAPNNNLDARELHLADAKTGPRTVQLPPMAVGILEELPRRAGSPWVFPGRDPERHLITVNHLWLDVRARAGLEDVRLHDLRHSCATWSTNILVLLRLFFSLQIRNHIVT